MDNRRQFDRENVRATVQLLAPVPGWGEMVDLGPGGFCLELDFGLAIGDRVVLRVLGYGRIFEMAPAHVRWVQPTGAGYLVGLSSHAPGEWRDVASRWRNVAA